MYQRLAILRQHTHCPAACAAVLSACSCCAQRHSLPELHPSRTATHQRHMGIQRPPRLLVGRHAGAGSSNRSRQALCASRIQAEHTRTAAADSRLCCTQHCAEPGVAGDAVRVWAACSNVLSVHGLGSSSSRCYCGDHSASSNSSCSGVGSQCRSVSIAAMPRHAAVLFP